MEHPVVIRVAKLATAANIAGSGAHTWREMPTPNADPTRTPDNEDWRPVHGSQALRQAIDARVALATEKAGKGVRPVPALEYVITANGDAFKEHGGAVDSTAYFRDALAWLEARHGADNIVAVNIQRDEHAPHMVAYVVPLVEVKAGKRKRSVIVGTNSDGTKRRETREFETAAATRLSAQHYVGTPDKLVALQTDFAKRVGQRHGLVRGIEGSKAKHQRVKSWYAQINAPAKHLRFTPEDVQPLVTKKGTFRDTRETPAEVADRLTQMAREAYAPAVEEYRTAQSERHRAAGTAKTIKDTTQALKTSQRAAKEAAEARDKAQAELAAYKSVFEEGITPDQQREVIALAERKRATNRERAEIERRARMTQEQRDQEAREEAAFQRSLREVEAEEQPQRRERDRGPSLG